MSNRDFAGGRSLIALAASRLALRAPALRAATALTRPNRSAQWLSCDRHGVPTAVTAGPSNIVTNHCVKHGQHLAHHGDDHDLRRLAGGSETIVEGLEHGIPIAGAHCRHVEHVTNGRTTAPDTARALEPAALEGIGGNANERGDLPAADLTELGQERN